MLTAKKRISIKTTSVLLKTSLFLYFLALCGLIYLQEAPAAAILPPVETEHLAVIDAENQLTSEQLQQFSRKAETTYLNATQFWSLNVKNKENHKTILELHPGQRGHSFSIFQMESRDGRYRSVVRVFGIKEPQQLAHKLTHAILPTQDKLIRNMMGIPVEERFGNILSFPLCGAPADAWSAALHKNGSLIDLADLGKNHEDWGMSFRGGMPNVSDRKRQHASYSEAGSFGSFLVRSFGVEKVKYFYDRSAYGARPWREAFGIDINALQELWVASLEEYAVKNREKVELLEKLWKEDPATACMKAQRKTAGK